MKASIVIHAHAVYSKEPRINKPRVHQPHQRDYPRSAATLHLLHELPQDFSPIDIAGAGCMLKLSMLLLTVHAFPHTSFT